jgi:hypothetical protein
VLEDRRDSELAHRFVVLEKVIRALRAEFEERKADPGGGRLQCAQCAAISPPNAPRWRAYLGYDLREDEWPEVFTFCPECAAREFEVGQ